MESWQMWGTPQDRFVSNQTFLNFRWQLWT